MVLIAVNVLSALLSKSTSISLVVLIAIGLSGIWIETSIATVISIGISWVVSIRVVVLIRVAMSIHVAVLIHVVTNELGTAMSLERHLVCAQTNPVIDRVRQMAMTSARG